MICVPDKGLPLQDNKLVLTQDYYQEYPWTSILIFYKKAKPKTEMSAIIKGLYQSKASVILLINRPRFSQSSSSFVPFPSPC
jgi:hypothetical protein